MISWWIGSASRPHGRGQCGATYPASASSRPLGDGWAAIQSRTADAPRVVVGRQLEVHRPNATQRRPPSRTRGSGARSSVAADDQRLELRGPVRGVGAAPTGRDGPTSCGADDDVGGVRPPRRRRGRRAARRRRRRAGQGRPVPLQRARVPGVGARRVQGRAGHVNTNYRYGADELVVPVGQRRRRRRRVPRRVQPSASTSCGPACRASARGCGSTTATARARTGRRRTRTPPRRRPADRRSRRGVAPATTSCCSTPAARPARPKGVMWRQDDLFGALDAANRKRLPPEADLDGRHRPGHQARPPQPAGGAADARHRLLQRHQQPDGRRQRRHDGGPPLRPRRAARHGRDRAHQLDVDRRRRLRQADPAGPRRRAGPLGHLVAAGDGVERRDLVVGDEVRPAAPQRPADHGRLARLQRGHRHGVEHRHRRRRRPDGVVPDRAQHPRRHGRRPRRRVGLRRAGPGGDARLHARRLLQGPREVGGHVPGHRRRALLDPRRLRQRRRRRHRAPARPGQPVHQHRRREGVPGGGRGGAQAAPDRRRRRRRRPARRALRRGHHRARRAPRRRRHRRGRADRPRQGAPRRLQGARSGSSPSTSVGRAANGKLDYRALKERALETT